MTNTAEIRRHIEPSYAALRALLGSAGHASSPACWTVVARCR